MGDKSRNPLRVAIIGTGRVGSSCAYALLLRGLVSEIVLINKHRERAVGEAMDLNHGMLFARPARVWAGDFADCAGADIVVLAAGVSQRPGETRMDLLKRNAAIFEDFASRVVKYTRDAILVVVTNPVDVLTHIARRQTDLPASQVIGSGTVLDTARFRYLLSQRFHVEPRSVHAFVIGEHGDSQVAVWSSANIAGIKLDEYSRLNGGALDEAGKDEITRQTRNAAYEIIRCKGSTYYAIAASLVRIIEAIVRDENSVLTVSSLIQGTYGLKEVCLSLPSIINRQGISHMLELPLELEEQSALELSAQAIRVGIKSLGY